MSHKATEPKPAEETPAEENKAPFKAVVTKLSDPDTGDLVTLTTREDGKVTEERVNSRGQKTTSVLPGIGYKHSRMKPV